MLSILLSIILNVFIIKSQCFTISSHNNFYTSSRSSPIFSIHTSTLGQKMQKIHHINCEIPIRKYEGDSPEVRMMENTLKQRRRAYLDKLNAEKLGIKVRKRHRGGRMDKITNERLATCTVKYLLLSPIKLTKILRQIKKMPVLLALGDLAQRGSNRYALAIYKAIKSALFNAKRLYGEDSTNSNASNSSTGTGSSGGSNATTTSTVNSVNSTNSTSSTTSKTTNTSSSTQLNSITGPLKPRFKELSATKGGYIKKPFFRAKGRCDIIRKPKAHLRVVLSV